MQQTASFQDRINDPSIGWGWQAGPWVASDFGALADDTSNSSPDFWTSLAQGIAPAAQAAAQVIAIENAPNMASYQVPRPVGYQNGFPIYASSVPAGVTPTYPYSLPSGLTLPAGVTPQYPYPSMPSPNYNSYYSTGGSSDFFSGNMPLILGGAALLLLLSVTSK